MEKVGAGEPDSSKRGLRLLAAKVAMMRTGNARAYIKAIPDWAEQERSLNPTIPSHG